MANAKLSFDYLKNLGFSRLGMRRLRVKIGEVSGFAWYHRLSKRKQGLVIAGLVILTIGVIASIFVINNHFKSVEIESATKAFQKFTVSRAKGDTNEIVKLISISFNENGIAYRDAVRYFSKKYPGYGANISEVKLGKGIAEITYKRTEIIEKKPVIKTISGEVWKKENGNYKLFRLSALDKALMKKEKEEKGDGKKKVPEKKVEKVETAITQGKPSSVILKSKSGKIIPPYSSDEKRDPFQSLIAGTEDEGKEFQGGVSRQCDPGRGRDFLESIDLMSMSLVGIISGEHMAALIETPNGSAYTLNVGMHIGRDCGKIIKIKQDRIIIAEKFYDRRTGFEVKNKEIKLRQEEE